MAVLTALDKALCKDLLKFTIFKLSTKEIWLL